MKDQITISDKSLNQDFLKSRLEVLTGEILAFLALEEGQTLHTHENITFGKKSGVKYVTWKISRIRFIMHSSRKKLEKKLLEVKSNMCPDCQKGLATSELKCRKDLKDFIFCEYMKRSLA